MLATHVKLLNAFCRDCNAENYTRLMQQILCLHYFAEIIIFPSVKFDLNLFYLTLSRRAKYGKIDNVLQMKEICSYILALKATFQ